MSLASISFMACSGDDNDEEDNPSGGGKTEDYSIVGVWESGKNFISFNSSGYCAAYIDRNYLDSGTYNQKGNEVSVSNSYYAKTTKYTITKLDNSSMSVQISYTDLDGYSKSRSLNLSKSSKSPISTSHKLVGKSITRNWSSTGYKITTSFNTHYTGSRTCSGGDAAKYPLRMFYVFYNNRVYYQLFKTGSIMPSIGGWYPTEEVEAWDVDFESDGSISSLTKVSL